MRKVIFFVLLLAVFLLALVTDWNVVQESRTARRDNQPPEVRTDDVLEVTVGSVEKGRPFEKPAAGPGTRPPAQHSPRREPAADPGRTSGHEQPAPPPAGNGGREAGPVRHIYTVQPGDTLSSIAEELYGDQTMTQKLIEWNVLENPDLIVPGMRLRYYK
jgi:nucleoid-associated protein YgaU